MMIGELMRAPPMTMFVGFKNSSYMNAGLHRGLERHTVMQKLRQHGVEIIAGPDQGIVNGAADAAAADLDQVFLQRLQVAIAQGTGIAEQVRQFFHAFKPRAAGKGEDQLVVVEHVEDEHVMAAVAEHFQAAKERYAV